MINCGENFFASKFLLRCLDNDPLNPVIKIFSFRLYDLEIIYLLKTCFLFADNFDLFKIYFPCNTLTQPRNPFQINASLQLQRIGF